MSHKKLRPFIVKVSVMGYFPLYPIYRLGVSCCINIRIMYLIYEYYQI